MQGLFWRNKPRFDSTEYRDSLKNRPNPGRGWYRVFSMDAALPCPVEEWKWERCGDEQLALLLIDLGRYANDPLSQEALIHINAAFAFFTEQGKELIVRFTYDTDGRGMEHEPSSVFRITEHIAQLSCVMKEYQDIIYCIQGLLIGSWGEMHSSKFLAPKTLQTLWKSLRDSAPKTCYFAVRKPEQYKTLTGVSYDSLTREEARNQRLGLFNDGLLGSKTDLGTCGEDELSESLDFQDKLCRYVPCGGEAVGDSSDIVNAVTHFKKIHVSYLNSVYDETVLSKWKGQNFDGLNGYDYIGIHLGYRFLVTDARLIHKNGLRLGVKLKNTGFANIYDACEIKLLILGRDSASCESMQTYDLRDLDPDRTVELCFPLPGSVADGSSVYLKLYRKKDGKRIVLANDGAEDLFLLGEIHL